VTVGGTLSTGTYGTINLNSGGTLQIGVGGTTGVLGVSTLTNNGTLVFNRSDDSTYSGIVSGSGAVTKQGTGRLTLDGANSYSGVTTISGGVLALSGTGAIGTGGLNLGSGGVFGSEKGTQLISRTVALWGEVCGRYSVGPPLAISTYPYQKAIPAPRSSGSHAVRFQSADD